MNERKNIFDREDNELDHVLPMRDSLKTKDYSFLIKNVEKTLKSSIDNIYMNLSSKICDLEKIQEDQIKKVNALNIYLNPDKENADKLNDLMNFKKKSLDQFTTYDFKIHQLQKDLSSATYKYDRMYLDNLILPGTIGDYCRHKNLKDYLEVTFNLFILK